MRNIDDGKSNNFDNAFLNKLDIESGLLSDHNTLLASR